MERAKLKGFQFDKTLSANFSSEQLTEINSLVSLSLFFSTLLPRFFDHPYLSPSSFFLHGIEIHVPPTWRGDLRFLSIFFDGFAQRIGQPTPCTERCKFAEFPGISSRLNAFNGSPVINNLLLSLVKDGQEVYSFLWINCYCY